MMNNPVGALAPPKLYVHLHPPGSMNLLEAVNGHVANTEQAKWLIEFGAVYIDQLRVIDAHCRVGPHNLIRVHLKPKRYLVDRQELLTRIIFENDEFMVVNKPSGLPMHPTLDNLYENLISSFGRTVHVTHRLDVPTSGLVLVAKTKEYQSAFNRVISNRAIRKTYQAVSLKPVAPAAYNHYMRKTVHAPKEVLEAVPQNEDPAEFESCQLIVKNCAAEGPLFISTIELITGRTHQIRAQLSILGSPLVGDEMYGGLPHQHFGLHASGLSFECPKSLESLSFSCQLPAFNL